MALWLAVPVLAVLAAEFMVTAHGMRVYPTRVRAAFVDADTGAPLAGVMVLTLPEPDYEEEADFLIQDLKERERELGPGKFRLIGMATTGPDGTVDIRLHPTSCQRISILRSLFSRDDRPPFEGIQALLVEKEGYGQQLIDCTKGTWTKHGGRGVEDLYATADLGVVPLRRSR